MNTISPYPHFSAEELACRCGSCGLGWQDMRPETMWRIVKLRAHCRFPLPVTSAIRCEVHNRSVGGSGLAHVHGAAVDIQIHGARALAIVSVAAELGFLGIGIKQHGPHNRRFIHLDDDEQSSPRPWIWTY